MVLFIHSWVVWRWRWSSTDYSEYSWESTSTLQDTHRLVCFHLVLFHKRYGLLMKWIKCTKLECCYLYWLILGWRIQPARLPHHDEKMKIIIYLTMLSVRSVASKCINERRNGAWGARHRYGISLESVAEAIDTISVWTLINPTRSKLRAK